MPALTAMNALNVFVFGLLLGAGWHVGSWLVGKILK
jgi:hypothetical protein